MKKDFINVLQKLGFCKSPMANLAKADEWYYEQFKVCLNDDGWVLYFSGKGIGDGDSFNVKDLFKLMLDHLSGN